MALSKSGNLYNRQNWEKSEYPILCQTCTGDNPYLRMIRQTHGKECKICTRPFTVFRWCPGKGMRFKKTEICQSCSRMKNVCQTCLLDLEYGLPVQVRDAALNIQQDEMPKSDVGREYYVQKLENELSNTDGTTPHGSLGAIRGTSEMLLKLARTAPYYKRNRPHICSFWVKGACKRGEECPYRHEKPTDPDDPLADQNIKDRYFGVNDPVADKLMKRYTDMVNGVDEDQTSSTGPKTSAAIATTTEYSAYPPPPPPPDMSLPPPVLLPPPGAVAGNHRYAYPSQDPERLGSGNYKQKS